MLDFLKYIPVIMQLVSIGGKVKEHLSTGGSVLSLLKSDGPGILSFITQIGSTFFPDVAGEEKQVQAAAMKVWDQDYVKGVQAALNKLPPSPNLKVDGDYGDKTKAAVKAYQEKNNLLADGWAGLKTNAALQSAVAALTKI